MSNDELLVMNAWQRKRFEQADIIARALSLAKKENGLNVEEIVKATLVPIATVYRILRDEQFDFHPIAGTRPTRWMTDKVFIGEVEIETMSLTDYEKDLTKIISAIVEEIWGGDDTKLRYNIEQAKEKGDGASAMTFIQSCIETENPHKVRAALLIAMFVPNERLV